MPYQRILMYFCTFASAAWFVLGVTYGVTGAYLCSALFVVLSFLYWDQEP